MSILLEPLPQSKPRPSVLCAQDADSILSDSAARGTIGVGDNSLEVAQDLALGKHRPVVGVEHVEPVELAASQDDNVRSGGVDVYAAAALCRVLSSVRLNKPLQVRIYLSGDTRCPKETRVLVHVQRCPAYIVRLQ